MCEVCKAEGIDWKFKNGPAKNSLYNSALYKVFKDSVASVRLCHVHSIELFTAGERKFLREHISFARALGKKARKSEQEDSSPFGF